MEIALRSDGGARTGPRGAVTPAHHPARGNGTIFATGGGRGRPKTRCGVLRSLAEYWPAESIFRYGIVIFLKRPCGSTEPDTETRDNTRQIGASGHLGDGYYFEHPSDQSMIGFAFHSSDQIPMIGTLVFIGTSSWHRNISSS